MKARRQIELAAMMEQVALRLAGERNEKLTKGDDWRYGKKGSLSVNVKNGTWYDHESKSGGGVLEFIRWHGEDDPIGWLRSEKLIEDDEIVATFDYCDENGKLVFQVCRTASKQFFQRRPNGQGWINNLQGVARILYRLPELIAGNSGDIVFIPEGEKHVDALIKLGLRATCNSGGAGNWLPKFRYSEFLKDQDVVILPDNDPQSTKDGKPQFHPDGRPRFAGQDHAQSVARNLHGIAKRIRVLMLPNLPLKGDVVDWLNAGGTKEQLLKLAEDTPEWKQPAAPKLIVSSAEFVQAFSPPDYLIGGLLQRRYVYSLTGPTGAGKTCVALRIAAHKASALALDGREIEKGRVLFFAGENPDDVRMRWIKLCEEMGHEPKDLEVYFMPGTPNISSDEIRKRIDNEVAVIGPIELLIVDTSAAYFIGDDENNNAQAGAHARMLRSFVDLSGGPTVIVTCHPAKRPDMSNLLPRGGGAFLNEMDGNLVCSKEPGSLLVELHWHGKFRGPDFAPIPFKLTPGTTDKLKDARGRPIWTVTATPVSNEEQSKLEQALERQQHDVLSIINEVPGISISDIATKLGWSYASGKPDKSKVQRALRVLEKHKLVDHELGRWVVTKSGQKFAQPWRPDQSEMPY
jgi:AAA domain-containing protein